jgi:hypothetical protein
MPPAEVTATAAMAACSDLEAAALEGTDVIVARQLVEVGAFPNEREARQAMKATEAETHLRSRVGMRNNMIASITVRRSTAAKPKAALPAQAPQKAGQLNTVQSSPCATEPCAAPR